MVNSNSSASTRSGGGGGDAKCKSCAVSHACLRCIAVLFWLTGAVICGLVAIKTVLGPTPADAVHVLGNGKYERMRWAMLASGVAVGALQGWLVMWRRMAAAEAQRILALSAPQVRNHRCCDLCRAAEERLGSCTKS